MKIAVLDDYQRVAFDMADWSVVTRSATVDIFDKPFGSDAELVEALGPYDILCAMRERTRLPGHILERLPKLRLIVTTGMRNAAIDMATAQRQGIVVCGTGSLGSSYLEHAWALILAAVRNIAAEDANMRRGKWQTTVGGDLEGRTLGLVGFGDVGTRMVPIAKAFGLNVIAWSPNLTEEKCRAHGVGYATRDALFATADIVSVHMVLSERTHRMIGAADFARMKTSAVFVNTSRGPLVDAEALLSALRERRIRMAALDVFDVEPLPPQDPLRGLDNVVLSPHLGFVTENNYRRYFGETVGDVEAYMAGRPIRVVSG